MTDTYKEQLRNYLTGKLNIQSSDNHPIFSSVSTYQNNLYTYISEHTVEPSAVSYIVIKGKDGNGNDLDEQLLVGYDYYTNSSFIVILDVLLNPIQFIDSYSSGTRFGYIQNLIVDDDGRFYGVEYNNTTNQYRFIMLNNILVKSKNQSEYKVVLRQSYNLPNSLQNGGTQYLIKKPLGNKYLFCATINENSRLYPLLVELTINVGTANEWVEYSYTANDCIIEGVWASWDNNDNITFKLIAVYDTIGNPNYLYVLKNSGSNVVVERSFTLPDPLSNWKQAVILNENTMYYSYCYDDENGVYNQYIYKVGDTLTRIFKSPNTDVAMATVYTTSIMYTDGYNAYISFNVPKANDSVDYYMGMIYNDVLYYYNFGNLEYVTSSNLYISNTFHQFNLYSYYFQLGDVSYTALSIFNNLNYNGLSYSDINGLVPSNVVLKNSDGVPIFARNLYNKVINNNTTISTVEIPNTLMNYDLGSALEIEEESLYSETNQEISDIIQSIDKNIYENVDINFYNTVSMKNINNGGDVINLNGAIRINKSSANDKDYLQAQATKVRINYSDGTHYIVAIDPSTQITISNGKATYSFMIYAPTGKNIASLEIISYDENTSYVEIFGTFTPGRYYTITQDVWVE